MKVPFTWKVTGWFMIGWSPSSRVGETRPLRYFGEDLVAYRDTDGELHVLSGHCRHLGAHIGHGGKVVGDCVECPFHGWRWGPDGTNRYIPYQPDRPNRALTLRVFPVREQYDCVFLWHQPNGAPPRWELPDLFRKFPQFETDAAAYLPSLSRVFATCRKRARAPTDRCRKRTGQCAFQVRPRSVGDTGVPELGGRGRGVAVLDRMAGCPQRGPRTKWRCGFTAIFRGWGLRSARSRVRPITA